MKRVRAVIMIADFFYEKNVDAEEALVLGDEVLTALEGMGMLPPKRYTNEGEEPTDPRYHGLNGWEPESE